MKYCPELDGLRAVAVVAVVLFHSAPYGVMRGGFVGVDLFFVLSAFLITSILAREIEQTGRIDLWRFYMRRFLRLVPALLLLLAAYLLVAPLIWPGHDHGFDAMLAGLYVSDYTFPLFQRPLYLQHTWSLAVEEQFYLIGPWLLLPLLKSERALLWLALAYATMLVWRLGFHDYHDYYYRFDTHATGLILGAALYFLRPKAGLAIGLVGTAMFAAVCLFGIIDVASAFIIPAEIGAAMMIAAAANGSLPAFRNAALVHIGKLSYAIYLWHFPIAHWARHHFDFAGTAAITLGASYLAALASYHTVEAWGRSMKKRSQLEPSPIT